MTPIASVQNLKKRYGEVEALRSLCFEVKKGEAVALLGPNGAGKSTALQILQGLRSATSGKVSLFGENPRYSKVKRRIGVTPQGTDFPIQLTPRELVAYASAHFDECESFDQLQADFGLKKLADRRVAGFSGGEKRRVALALAFVGKPRLVFLDEPTTGLDDHSQEAFVGYVKRYVDKGGSVLLTTHHWPEIDQVADRVVMIDAGELVLEGDISQMKQAVGLKRVRFECETPNAFVKANFVLDQPGWTSVTTQSDEIVRQLGANDVRFEGLEISPIGLKEIIEIYRSKQEGAGS